MEFVRQKISDIITIEPRYYNDSRGYFAETYRKDKLEDFLGHEINFVQDNQSQSQRGVLRGLHFQLPPFAQSKLVHVIQGKVFDVAVDIRLGSPSFGEYVAVELSDENKVQMFIPRGFAHGFLVLSDSATFAYKVDNFYSSTADRGLAFDDVDLNINWPLHNKDLLISEKDQKQPRLADLTASFKYAVDYYE